MGKAKERRDEIVIIFLFSFEKLRLEEISGPTTSEIGCKRKEKRAEDIAIF